MKRCLDSLRCTLFVFLVLILPQLSTAQSTPFLSDDEVRMLVNEISGDRAFEHIRWLSHWHRDSGMDGFFKAADYVVSAAKDAGLEDVRFVEQQMTSANYTAKSAELWMLEPVQVKLADIGDHALSLADGSSSADVTAELVWIGNGSKEALKDLDVTGKIILINGSPGTAVINAVWGKGAIGMVCYTTSEGKSEMDFPDQIPWTRIPSTPPEGKKGTFAFTLAPRKGDALRQLLQTNELQDIFATGKKTKGGRVLLKAKVETVIGTKPGRTGFVEGWIRGSKYHDQQIILTAHLQEEQGSANDDGSGSGNLLELGRVWSKLIREGNIQRPLRDIRFWWTDEIASEYRYFADNPEEPKKFLANLHQDMVGANQAMGSRVQHLILPPHSRTSYLDAVFQSVGTFVILTNNAFLAASRQGGLPRPFTRPMFATRGSRQAFNGRFVPHFGSSDHMTFLDGPIGVPAVALINWDDDYIHSSDDDLDKIDQTQLKRNAFIIGGMSYFLAYAEADKVPLLVGETFSQGTRWLANDLQVAMNILRQTESKEEAWSDATMTLEEGIKREIRALNSVRVFAGSDAAARRTIDEFVARMKERESELMDELKGYFKIVYRSAPPPVRMNTKEQAAHKKVPANNPNLKEYFDNRSKVRFRGSLHRLMSSEVYNFVDGKRSFYDIYKAVRAEALTAGSWYYGTVSLEDVAGLLDAAVEAQALTLTKGN